MLRHVCLSALCAFAAGPVAAETAQVLSAEAIRTGASTWTISVTLLSDDTGWDSYADGWRIEAPDGTILGTRVLLHPHVDEQPFTRSLSNVAIPPELGTVEIRARTLNLGWQDTTHKLPLPRH